MSVEEDTELRDLVGQTLEANGCLSRIRAQLRASVFLALDEDEDLQTRKPFQDNKIKSYLESLEGRAMFCLVREFLEFFDLDFTISVYEPESYLGSGYKYDGRYKIIEDLGLPNIEENSTVPLLLQLIKLAQRNTKVPNTNAQPTKIPKPTINKVNDIVSTKEASDIIDSKSGSSLSKTKTPKVNLNETFNVTNGHQVDEQDINQNTPRSVECTDSKELLYDKDDTYEGTSSITEDTISKEKDCALIDLDKSVRHTPPSASCANPEKSKSLMDQSLMEHDISPQIVKEMKLVSKFDTSKDKLKLSPQKNDKLKPKSSLSSLSDLPPLQLNKSRDTMVLPSLYNKEFRKSELDKFLDSCDNYEEDFMSGNELDLGLSNTNLLLSNSSKVNLLEQNASDSSEKSQATNRKSETSKSNGVNAIYNYDKENSDVINSRNESVASSITSEDLNSNVDDILNSHSSK